MELVLPIEDLDNALEVCPNWVLFQPAGPVDRNKIHDVSIKTKPNCLCHIYLLSDGIILKLSRYLEN